MASLERFSRQAFVCEHCLCILQKKREAHSCPAIFATPQEQSPPSPSLRAFRRGIFQAGPSVTVPLFMDPSRLEVDTSQLEPVRHPCTIELLCEWHLVDSPHSRSEWCPPSQTECLFLQPLQSRCLAPEAVVS